MVPERLLIIGDVHGDARRLETLLSRVDLEGRVVVFLGDYVNRGPDSRIVLDILCCLKRTLTDRVVFLVGNHELALLRYLRDGDLARFAVYGGIATIRSYVSAPVGDVASAFREAFPQEHRSFLDALHVFQEFDGLLLSHTGLDPKHPENRSLACMAETSHPALFIQAPMQTVVCGHYVQREGRPLLTNRLMCIDTGCGTAGGPLTALFLPERSCVQA